MIKHVATSAVALTLLAAPGLALAADATGTVRSWNEQSRQLVLDNGQTYVLQANMPAGPQLAPGQRVTLTFDMQGNQNMVTRIVPAAGAAAPGAAGGADPARDAVEMNPGGAAVGGGAGAGAGGAAGAAR